LCILDELSYLYIKAKIIYYIKGPLTMADKTTSKKASSGTKKAGSGYVTDSAPITEAEELTTEYHDDYRNLLANYDPMKNKSAPEMTKYEMALVIGKRATQIANGAIPLIDVPARMYKVDEIAEEELRQKKTPFIIRRDLGNSKYEYWKVKDMKLP
jgi:DNA-directed RNA polymerase I, II, and III subunit RPABC2